LEQVEQKLLEVTIRRGGPDESKDEVFRVPAQENQTILDVVSWIQQYSDPTLTYRFACRVGMCGSCAMMVNGEPRWTCRTHVKKVLDGDKVHIAPLRNLPVIKDLAVDMDPFFDKWVAAEGKHHPTQTRNDPIQQIDPESAERSEANAGIECINCSVCYAACDTVAGSPDYLGPAALQRAWTLFNDAKNENQQAILDAVSGTGGCHNCHSMGSCTHYCPNELNPLAAIAGLKRETASSFFKRRKNA
jgi:fumarate reductase iron-sulfur subunit